MRPLVLYIKSRVPRNLINHFEMQTYESRPELAVRLASTCPPNGRTHVQELVNGGQYWVSNPTNFVKII